MIAVAGTQAPSSPQAPLEHSLSSLQARQDPSSQTGSVADPQSACSRHSTHLPVCGSQTSVSPNREQSLESTQPVQVSVATSHTGASAPQPCVEQDGTMHWKSTQACPTGHGRSSVRPRRPQLSTSTQQTPGTGGCRAARSEQRGEQRYAENETSGYITGPMSLGHSPEYRQPSTRVADNATTNPRAGPTLTGSAAARRKQCRRT